LVVNGKQGLRAYICYCYQKLAKIKNFVFFASEIWLKILTWHRQAKAGDFLGPDQFGFRKGCGTCDAIAALRVMCEGSLENNNKVYIFYVDFEKAFDRINLVKLLLILATLE